MAHRTLVVASVAAVLAAPTLVSAKAPAPLVPTALVEDVKGGSADVEFMDYVGSGQVIKLAPQDVLVLSYLKSCAYETITGGTVVVGADHSEVKDGQIERSTVPCDGGKIHLTAQQASKSAATAIRLQSAEISPVLYARTPVVQLPRDVGATDRTLKIVRTDRKGKHKTYEIKIDDSVAVGGFYDLAKSNIVLDPGAVYEASIGDHAMPFSIDTKAKSGSGPVISRLLRVQ
jgi:hypothetical protein